MLTLVLPQTGSNPRVKVVGGGSGSGSGSSRDGGVRGKEAVVVRPIYCSFRRQPLIITHPSPPLQVPPLSPTADFNLDGARALDDRRMRRSADPPLLTSELHV